MKEKCLKIYFCLFGLLAKFFLKRHNPFIIGITGSIGKTSLRTIIYEILYKNLERVKVYSSSKNFNGELGLSLSILGISNFTPDFFGALKTILIGIKRSLFGKKLYDIIILEYGVDHIGEMDFLLSIAKPDIGIISKIDKVHSLEFKDKRMIAKEKYKLLQYSKSIAILNLGDEFYLEYIHSVKSKKYFYSTNINNSDQLDLYGKNYFLKLINNDIQSLFDFYVAGEKKFSVTSNLIGEENVGYMSIGFFILEKLHKKYNRSSFFKKVNENIFMNFTLQASRFNKFTGIDNSILIDSSYNAAPKSMKKVIDNFFMLKNNIFSNYETILCIGEMRELGDYTQKEHEKLGKYLKGKSKNIFVVGDSMKNYVLPILNDAKYFKNSKILGKYLKDFILKNKETKYLILFKGSQNTIFLEEAVKEVLENESDKNKLCRQENFWMEKKNKFFSK